MVWIVPVLNPPPEAEGGTRRKRVATRKKTRRRGGSKKRKNPRGGSTWAESAMQAGAYYGVGHPREGLVMSKPDALKAKIPVPRFLTPTMIRDWHSTVVPGVRKNSKAYKAAVAKLKKQSRALAAKRAKRPITPAKRDKKFRSKLKYQKAKAKKLKTKAPKRAKPFRSVGLLRGRGVTKKKAGELIEAGFAVKPTAAQRKKGLRMAANPKRRRKSAKKKAGTRRRRGPGGRFKANPKRKRKTTAKKRRKTTKKRKTTAKKRKNPRRKTKARKNPKRKVKRTAKGRFKKMKANPKRKKAKARKGKKRKFAMAKYKRNPGVMTALKAQWSKFTKPPIWITAFHALAGMGGTIAMDHYFNVAPWVPMALKRRGIPSLALTAGSGVLVSTGAFLLEGLAAKSKSSTLKKATQNMGTNVLVGSLVTVVVKAAYELMPDQAAKVGVPRLESGRVMAAAPAEGTSGLGYYSDGPDYSRGFGSVESPEDLVAGESLARQVNEFHGLGQGGHPVPIEDIRGMGDWMELSGYPGQYGGGYGGMGDWVEMEPQAPMVQQGFNPAVENF